MSSPARYLDLGPGPSAATLVVGSGRSGTTWVGNVIAKMTRARPIFEPLLLDEHLELALATERQFKPDWLQSGRLLYIEPNLGPESRHHARIEAILSGRVRSVWTDRGLSCAPYFRRVIKEIRANLLLPYICRHWPGVRVIWIVRNPVAVVSSQMIMALRYGWTFDKELEVVADGRMDRWLSEALMALRSARTLASKLAHRWCIETMLPLKAGIHQLPTVELVSYENLASDSTAWRPISRLVAGTEWSGDGFQQLLRRPSPTSRVLVERHLRSNPGCEEPSADDMREVERVVHGYGLTGLLDPNSVEATFSTITPGAATGTQREARAG